MRAIAADRALAGDISCDSIAVAMVLPISIYVRVAMGCLASGFLGGRGLQEGFRVSYRMPGMGIPVFDFSVTASLLLGTAFGWMPITPCGLRV